MFSIIVLSVTKAVIQRTVITVTIGITCLAGLNAHADEWVTISNKEELTALYSDVVHQGPLTKKATWRAEYCKDGSGTEWAWGVSFPRAWKVTEANTVCITSAADGKTNCYRYEKSTSDDKIYRGTDVLTHASWVLTLQDAEPESCKEGVPKATPPADKPAPAAKSSAGPSAAEMAKKLANPTLAIGQMINSFITSQYRGTLPGSNDQDSLLYKFQPVLPFPTGSGKSFLLRPTINVFIDQPVFNASTNQFDEESFELGDTTFDFVYGGTSKAGLLLSYGVAGTLPTSTSDVIGGDQWALGPEILVGQVFDWGLAGLLLNHQWDVASDNNKETNLTAGQYFYAVDLGGGSFLTSGPGFAYNHEATSGNQLTFPLGIGLSKTTKIGNRVWKFAAEYWYYVEHPDVFGPQHLLKFSITPVVELPWSR